MVPIALFMGLAGGFTKLRWWSIPAAGGAWALILAFTGDTAVNPILRLLGGLAIGSINGAIGAAAAIAARSVIKDLRQRLGSPRVRNG